jgi:PadR family transcriptional regulator, regulatory protein PadR
MDVRDFPTLAEMRVMQLLQDAPKGLYGLQIVERSNGAIKRGSVYVLLGRLEEKGFIDVTRTQEANHPGLPRPHYRLNAAGARVLATAESMGMLAVGA